MQVILTEDISSLGKKGEIKEVNLSYAHNFLLPQKKAIIATKQNINQRDSLIKKKKKEVVQRIDNYQKIIKTLDKQGIKFSGKISTQEHLFQAIHEVDIIRSVKKNFNITLESKWFKNFTALKDLGEHKVDIFLPDNQKIVINIKIEAL